MSKLGYYREVKAHHDQHLSGSMFVIYNDASCTMFAIPQENKPDSFSPNESMFWSAFKQVTAQRIKCKTSFWLAFLLSKTRKQFILSESKGEK